MARRILLWVVVAAACYVAYGFGRLWADWRQATHPPASRQALPVELRTMDSLVQLSGQWFLDDMQWSIRSTEEKRADVTARLTRLATPSNGNSAEEFPDLTDDLRELARSLNVKPVQHGGNQVYSIDRPDLAAQMVTRKTAGREKIVSLAAAVPRDDGQWQVFELSPSRGANTAAKEVGHLLPLPQGAQRNGGRFGDAGRLVLEFVRLESNGDSLRDLWRKAGWTTHPSDLTGSDNFSDLCVRGDETIYAWSPDPPQSLRHLMLVRTPASADTQ